jgi:hypothetical protein
LSFGFGGSAGAYAFSPMPFQRSYSSPHLDPLTVNFPDPSPSALAQTQTQPNVPDAQNIQSLMAALEQQAASPASKTSQRAGTNADDIVKAGVAINSGEIDPAALLEAQQPALNEGAQGPEAVLDENTVQQLMRQQAPSQRPARRRAGPFIIDRPSRFGH